MSSAQLEIKYVYCVLKRMDTQGKESLVSFLCAGLVPSPPTHPAFFACSWSSGRERTVQVWMLSVVFSSFCCCQVNISELGLVTQSGKVVWGKSARVHRSPWSYPHPVSLPQGSTHRSQTTLRMMVVSMQSCLYEHTTHTHHIACIISNFII